MGLEPPQNGPAHEHRTAGVEHDLLGVEIEACFPAAGEPKFAPLEGPGRDEVEHVRIDVVGGIRGC